MRMRTWVVGAIVAAVAGTMTFEAKAADPIVENKGKDKTIEFKLSKMDPKIVQKITDAMPAEAPAKPAKERNLLIYTRAVGFVHGSIPYAATAIKMLGEKTKAYNSVITDDAAMFEADSLKKFDAVFFVSTTGELFDMDNNKKISSLPKEEQEITQRRRDALMAFIKGGKGWGGLHAACDSNRQFPEFLDMSGGLFMQHPYFDITVHITDPKSPLTAMFDGKNFKFHDEMYVFTTPPFTREKNHVLLQISTEEPPKEGLDKGRRPDKDYAISWIKKYGEGRVFYCSFGHFEKTFFSTPVLKHYLAGIQYSMGDLKADDTPSGGASSPAK
jgi:type 1 glutamine amidotransferase